MMAGASFDITRFAEVTRLLEELAPREAELSPNEREMYRSLKARYAEPGQTSFDDKTCLEVMLRNIEVRRRHGLAPGDQAERQIKVTKGPGSGN
jgi:hypothetical protein